MFSDIDVNIVPSLENISDIEDTELATSARSLESGKCFQIGFTIPSSIKRATVKKNF